MSNDGAERRRAEKVLREDENASEDSKAQYEKIFSMISDIVWRFDINTNGEHIDAYISPVADRMLGLPEGTIGNCFDKYFLMFIPMTCQSCRRCSPKEYERLEKIKPQNTVCKRLTARCFGLVPRVRLIPPGWPSYRHWHHKRYQRT